MRKKRASASRKLDQPISWLPIDSRLIVPFLSFGHVRGFARLFLQMEIVFSILVVAGTLILALMKIMGNGV